MQRAGLVQGFGPLAWGDRELECAGDRIGMVPGVVGHAGHVEDQVEIAALAERLDLFDLAVCQVHGQVHGGPGDRVQGHRTAEPADAERPGAAASAGHGHVGRQGQDHHVLVGHGPAGHLKGGDHAADGAEAINRAREIVTNLGGGEVVIHRPDGTIRDSDTVGGGNDPNPPTDRK